MLIKRLINMDSKAKQIRKAIDDMAKKEITLYHIIPQINKNQFAEIQKSGYFEPSKNALGGQSDGYYFFTTRQGAEHHIKTNKDLWNLGSDNHAFIAESVVDLSSVKYPNWKLDYEAMQDFLFDMIYDAASKQNIRVNNVEFRAGDDKKLIIFVGGKFSKIKSFSANKHSGLIEQVADFLYHHDKQFQRSYDNLLMDVFMGKGENQELYAVKTKEKQKITKITEIEKDLETPKTTQSQTDKFFARYGRKGRA